nr:hypothetical protein CFP56_43947 [Quercus suber]
MLTDVRRDISKTRLPRQDRLTARQGGSQKGRVIRDGVELFWYLACYSVNLFIPPRRSPRTTFDRGMTTAGGGLVFSTTDGRSFARERIGFCCRQCSRGGTNKASKKQLHLPSNFLPALQNTLDRIVHGSNNARNGTTQIVYASLCSRLSATANELVSRSNVSSLFRHVRRSARVQRSVRRGNNKIKKEAIGSTGRGDTAKQMMDNISAEADSGVKLTI